ncbi:class I SAM-dependent methyltransferase [Constantimarinum furrinae]|uniref:SAM-dependent methyltransferase n=1 Tax=Constantimarinum furrinae TaxID=2562285 RepID=A0A7G8PWV3_9FLAO|nr:class I SAM-dependent methyltransferase [Constantimarinum furrinae]QNJ98819.1 SAM-dependent methyltransferase [Constantimarinum furrinae]
MNKNILHTEVQHFIKTYDANLSKLAFSGSPFPKVTVQELLQQIEGYRKAESKLPGWSGTDGIYYPLKLNLEQTSSETTAKYKASLFSGKAMADLTGGFGVDSYFFSEQFETVYHFEKDTELSSIATHNFKTLNRENIKTINRDAISAIEHMSFDLIYADPSRRHSTKGKVFYLRDCEPNIPDAIDYLLERCEVLMIKTSPMLDISVGIQELQHVFEIHIVAVKNDVKELIWMLKKGNSEAVTIKTRNFVGESSEKFDFEINSEAEAEIGDPEQYLYEPNAAILKSGAFNHIAQCFKLRKLHKNTHLYSTNQLIEFPGRRFKIESAVPYSKKEMRAGITFDKANVATRNFPETVSGLKKRWKITDGGDLYVFFTTGSKNQKMMLLCSKI